MTDQQPPVASGAPDGRQGDLTRRVLSELIDQLQQVQLSLDAAEPLEVLAAVRDARQVLSRAEECAVRQALVEREPWSAIGSAAVIRRQSAHGRWAHLDPRGEPQATELPVRPVRPAVRRQALSVRLAGVPLLPALRLEIERGPAH